MQTNHDRLEDLAEAVAKAQPYLDAASRRVALATYRRLAEGTPAPVEDIAGRAGQAFVSFLLPSTAFGADIIQRLCHFVHSFASRDAGESWTAEHPGTFLLSLEDAFELGRLVNARTFPSLAGERR